jgi:NosR/NirI family transcriptional regulator, nitrous oxide reductase regulator
MRPEGALQVSAGVKEELLAELRAQVEGEALPVVTARAERVERRGDGLAVIVEGEEPLLARAVLVAIGRSGNHRRLGVPGDDLEKVHARLFDPAEHPGQRVLVVGGGDQAVEAAVALARSGAQVDLAHRGPELVRPKQENLRALEAVGGDGEGRVRVWASAQVAQISASAVALRGPQGAQELPNDVVFAFIGRDAPLEFFRRSGVAIRGERTWRSWAAMLAFVALCAALYNWKSGGVIAEGAPPQGSFPYGFGAWLTQTQAGAADPRSWWGVLAISGSGLSFWFSLAYSAVVVVFGVQRIRRRATPYVTWQTLTLMAVQVVPLFLLPELLLPWLHHQGLLPEALADALFPRTASGHGREFWRAYGFVLAWPLMIYNVFTSQPLWAWLAIAVAQTFVLIPVGIYFFGKGFYCGWICSCGALAETLGDRHRHKMPHGPGWNRLNLVGQLILALALAMLALRILGWVQPGPDWAERTYRFLMPNYKWTVDVFLAGVLGIGLYFWYSGRVWCRFFCPLSALMNVYTRLGRFRIFAEKKKCISCGVCTAVCHQGIDVMAFAQRGLPMDDPQCVRCSACVQSCPTGVLSFGRLGEGGQPVLDTLLASPVHLQERAEQKR